LSPQTKWEVGVSAFARGGANPTSGEIRDALRDPFVAAVCATLGEMVGVEAVVRSFFPKACDAPTEGFSAVLDLQCAVAGPLLLSFPAPTASALAARILAGVTGEIDDGLIRDCVGEIANVVAGQAKAMLSGTAYQFTFAIPNVLVDGVPELLSDQEPDCLGISFDSELGDFTLRLYLIR
jgi:chemotaxis protein CheX